MYTYSDLLRDQYLHIRQTIFEAVAANSIRGRGRGVLRRKLQFSVGRLKTLLDEENIEVTLQRVIVALMSDDQAGWHNEFAVSGGVYGGNRFAVDMVRTTTDRKCWDFFELKEWDAPDTPFDAAIQIVTYFLAFSPLCQKRVPPYECPPETVRLWLIAPEKFFEKFGGANAVCAGLRTFEDAIRNLRKCYPEIGRVSFVANPLVLDGTFTRTGFISCFDKTRVKSFVDSGELEKDPISLLIPSKVDELRRWIRRAIDRCRR